MLLGYCSALLWAPLVALVGAQEEDSLLIDCYRWNGEVIANNTKCPNSNACCGPTATCLSNRLCHNRGDEPNTFVRGPCAVREWDDCAQICQYDEFAGIFPRVTVCPDGSLCCNNDRQCCQDRKGIFLDENGNVVSARATAATTSYPPIGGGPSRYTLTPSTSTTTQPTDESSSSSPVSQETVTTTVTVAGGPSDVSVSTVEEEEEEEEDNGDDTTGLKIGLGVGIPLSVLVAAAGVYFLTTRHHRGPPATAAAAAEAATTSAAATEAGGGEPPASSAGYPYPPPQQGQYPTPGMQSLESAPTYYTQSSSPSWMAAGMVAGQQQQQQQQPVEVHSHETAELDATNNAGLNGAGEKTYLSQSGGGAAQGWYAPGEPDGAAKRYV
ncbi:hypothetical protein VTH82DRAFT_7101 [Thermothelomyces myriococcoides]